MNKKTLSERDICTKFITPALDKAGWKDKFLEEVYFTDGRIRVVGKMTTRGKSKRADYILYYKPNIPVAIVEAKDNKHTVSAGLQQALEYAHILDIPCVFSSNGDGFIFHDRTATDETIEQELTLDEFPTPAQLWERYKAYKGIVSDEEDTIAQQDYYTDGSGRNPRYYQQIAINRTVEAIAKGQNRILLVMATGTGKTYTAFQMIYRLWKSGRKKRILFLADRNALIDQTRRGDFKHFRDKMTVIRKRVVDVGGKEELVSSRRRGITATDKAYEIFLGLYQGLTGSEGVDAYKDFSPDFFDLIVVDECHRGSAADDSSWRAILDYFKGATQVGLTATHRETESEGLEPTETGSALLLRIRAEKAELIRQGKLRKEKLLSPITDAEKPFELPEGWVWCRLGEIGIMDRGKSKHRPRNDDKLFMNGCYPFVQTGDVAQSKKSDYQIKTYSALYNEKGLAQSKKWPAGTLCITIAANIAETGFLSFDACFPDSVVGFTSLVGNVVSVFVRYYLEVSKTEIERFAPATAQKNINLGILDELFFPLPSLAEQQIIVAQVERLMAQVSLLEIENKQQQAEVGRLMQVVLREAFAGKEKIEMIE